MKRYLRTFRRHKLLVIAPVVLALVIGLGYELTSPRSYHSQATLWADTPVPASSTVLSTSPPAQSPASQAASVLSEMLATNQFLTELGKRSPYAAYLRQHPGAIDTVFASLQKDTSVSVLGPQVMGVTYQSSDPATTAPMARAISSAFVVQLLALQRTRDQQEITYDKQNEQTALDALNSQQKQLSEYLAAHPQPAGATVDPTVTQLSGNVADAEQVYGNAVAAYNATQLGLSSAADSSALHVIDQPAIVSVAGHKKKIVEGGIGGLFLGGVISLLLLSWLVSKDTSPWDAEDVEDDLGLTVVGSIEQLPSGRRRDRSAS
jgi:capsular polysaccharide biosynthesis protein